MMERRVIRNSGTQERILRNGRMKIPQPGAHDAKKKTPSGCPEGVVL
jgi:hypothetical protein